ncbi:MULTISPECIES: MgtC/SapB family protein [Rhodopseudomonas]|uniref:Membrane protein n=1 Tax=Rhodopseudomonas palustris TaxID=1076 RepID=A0A0D7F5F8_RHOPL|nr:MULTISPECIES: DUF4010 domain-containing protein [Rhodopseudomonas]KIZ48011.1 membrane protein [Rhodopseudomonas palustris]WOK16559.1 DUF4010 domain-containing protein [Rhodopseudomonas sp. BAL398]
MALTIEPVILNLVIALGIGLLIGVERERRKGDGPSRAPAGIRTFAIASLSGAISVLAGGDTLLAVVTAGAIALTAVAYWRGRETDPGLTTEMALIATVLLGGLAIERAALAGGLAVTVALLLAARDRLHRFVRQVLTEQEVEDGLIFASASLVVLPLVPDRPMGPYGALNPHTIWIIVLLIMAIGAAGHLAVRLLGARFGLPLAGLASGFISSTATIGAMGARAAKAPESLAAAVGGAVLSTVATIVQLAIVLAATSPATLRLLAVPLLCAGLTSVVYGVVFTVIALRRQAEREPERGRAFSLPMALTFGLTLSVIMVAAAALQDLFGDNGMMVAAAVAGFVDAHSSAISVASLVGNGKIAVHDALLPILAGFSTNTISKIVLAGGAGGWAFALRVVPGLILVALAAWAGALLAPITM